MKVTLELTDSDLRSVVYEALKIKYPGEVLTSFASNDFQVKMTYRANETWRRPKHIRLLIERDVRAV